MPDNQGDQQPSARTVATESQADDHHTAAGFNDEVRLLQRS
jgi:hypothetical protein